MMDMVERPEWLHRFMTFMRDGVLTCQAECEAAGDWRLTSGSNQAMCYSLELPDPKPNSASVKRNQLWCFLAAQEYAWVGPRMHEEFLLHYQMEIMKNFGLVAYGCCEDLTKKLDMLKKVPRMRRIGITPQADVRASAENLKRDYVLSWRPNPSLMICNGFDPPKVKTILTDAMEAAKGCNIEIFLKDVQTIYPPAQDWPSSIEPRNGRASRRMGCACMATTPYVACAVLPASLAITRCVTVTALPRSGAPRGILRSATGTTTPPQDG